MSDELEGLDWRLECQSDPCISRLQERPWDAAYGSVLTPPCEHPQVQFLCGLCAAREKRRMAYRALVKLDPCPECGSAPVAFLPLHTLLKIEPLVSR